MVLGEIIEKYTIAAQYPTPLLPSKAVDTPGLFLELFTVTSSFISEAAVLRGTTQLQLLKLL